jgi:glutamate racemase
VYKIGVFDSGVGGLSVAKNIKRQLPTCEVVYINDKKNIPYGNKTKQELYNLTLPKLNKLTKQECDVVVIACNTVTTNIVNKLRMVIDIPIIAVEPMVKTASEKTKTGVITVCATPSTLKSERYNYLKKTYASNLKVYEPDCSNWSYMIEHNKINKNNIKNIIEQSIKINSDVIVLACTHYHWIEDLIKKYAKDKAVILQPEQAIINQLKTVLANLKT